MRAPVVWIAVAALLTLGCPKGTPMTPQAKLPEEPPTETCAEVAARMAPELAAIVEAYSASPRDYWARFGFPADARLADIREALGLDADVAFGGAMAAFDAAALERALAAGSLSRQLPAAFAQQRGQRPSAPLDAITMRVIRSLVDAVDAQPPRRRRRSTGGPTALLAELYDVAFPDLGELLAPAVGKACADDLALLLADSTHPIGGGFDCAEGEDFDPCCLVLDGKDDDSDTSEEKTVKWEDISSTDWETTYNPSCVGQAYGPCASKLGIFDGDCTCQDWNEFGENVGVESGGKGAKTADIHAWFKTQGYCTSTAWDGLSESACEEAKKALDRGCDVIFRWPTHVEMVTGITVDASDDEKCTVATSSWGSAATVTYDSGKAFNKSDKNTYNSKSSVQKEGGKASLYYICKC